MEPSSSTTTSPYFSKPHNQTNIITINLAEDHQPCTQLAQNTQVEKWNCTVTFINVHSFSPTMAPPSRRDAKGVEENVELVPVSVLGVGELNGEAVEEEEGFLERVS
ncbi:hypothetical protein C1H46_007739 [Malus baccata]|uniref:Uncharacterized protein n=1 Tax=Malus baccata TaxID=106549 RepID=A0A540N806_MALBA|nr:hypothetical protein C1H46_007739 [Malus baccata]